MEALNDKHRFVVGQKIRRVEATFNSLVSSLASFSSHNLPVDVTVEATVEGRRGLIRR